MKNISIGILLLFANTVKGQEGIKFNQTISWSAAMEKAKIENKLIFIDCYTSWCAPCKWMDQNVFVDGLVADFYNDRFINLKVDMEKGEGIELRNKYNVRSFPSFLFVNYKGEIVHRTGGKMEVEAFLAEGKIAVNPTKNTAFLAKKYETRQRDLPFLLAYYFSLQKVDNNRANQIGKEISTTISENELKTELGWEVIKALARNHKDKLGAYFMANPLIYDAWSTAVERMQLMDRLITYSMYGYINAKDKVSFEKVLPYFSKSDQPDRIKQGILLASDFYLEMGNVAEYANISNSALQNYFKDDANKLSYLARRANFKMPSNPIVLEQAYLMSKRAVSLKNEDYAIQSTFASVCLSLKKKEEALIAAKKSRVLANGLTSKIQKIAQDLLEKIALL